MEYVFGGLRSPNECKLIQRFGWIVMTDSAPPHLAQPPRRPRALSRIHALLLALVLIVGGVAIARADRADPANLTAPGGL